MQKTTAQIIWHGLAIGYASCIYFLSLVAGLPFSITIILALAVALLFYRFAKKNIVASTEISPNKTTAIFATALLLLVAASCLLMPAQGDWDASGIWNFHARYLAQPHHWQQLFHNGKFSHTDYPALLPSCIAFLWRLCGSETELVPFGISAIATLLIPVLIFFETYRKSITVAVIATLSFAINTVYIRQGLGQYADTLVAFFFLGAFVCMQHYRAQAKPAYILCCAGMLGCAMWTKNEGIMLAAVFGLFYLNTLLKHLRHTLAGLLPFVITLLVYKSYAPANDLVQGQHSSTMSKLTDVSRYRLIAAYFLLKLNAHFYVVKIATLVYLIYCAVKKRMPAKPLLVLATCFAGYVMVYVLTPNDLAWHLGTSADRLVQQLLPATMYVLALEASTALAKGRQQ
jgi:hypothetical protein